MKPTRIWQYLSDHGARCEFVIETARGLFAGIVSSRWPTRRISTDQVDVWHPVPRWMPPGEVLRSLQP